MDQALTNNEKHRFSANFLKNINDELCKLHEKRDVTLRDIYESLGLIGSYYVAEEFLDQVVYPKSEKITNEICLLQQIVFIKECDIYG